jgi:HK97 family phage major capsid protein
VLKVASKSDADAPETGEQENQPSDLIQAVEQEFAPKFEELTEATKSLAEVAEEAAKSDADDAEQKRADAQKQIEVLDEKVKSLTAERDRKLLHASAAELRNTEKSLQEYLKAAREPHGDFTLGGSPEEADENPWGEDAGRSFFQDVQKTFKQEGGEEYNLWKEQMADKAMTQASGSTGGYLVPPQVSSELLRAREQTNILRPLLSRIQVNADVLRIAAQRKGLLAGWVAELAEKPESELSFGEVSVNVFWKAGMAVVSNQLLRNSNPSIDALIYNELGRRLAALEEIAFLSGSGTGQPLGILKTPGVLYSGGDVGGIPALSTTDIDDLLDNVIDAITAIYTEYFGAPNAIVMHPRTWARIIKERKEDATAEYIVGGSGTAPRTANERLPLTAEGRPTGSLFGLPVYTTRNVPVNAGAGDDESRVIVGNFQEGLILDHAGITLDSSEHVYFRTNQTIFRAEDAVGFTAARYPRAFAVVGGTGLADG